MSKKKPIGPLGVVAFSAVGLGIILWIWTGNWRWAATSLGLFIMLAAIDAGRDRRRDKRLPPQNQGDY